MLNVTVDDASTVATLSYGPGWGVASSDDVTLSQYFQSTYHASETPGALINLTFSGIGIYLFGSKGPDRGNFSVRYDSTIELLSAHADEPKYQQLLFKATFQSDATPHTLTLNNTSDGPGGKWVDLDFLTITSNEISSSGTHQISSTISPLPMPSRAANSGVTQSPTAVGSEESPNASITTPTTSSNTTLILAIVFGITVFLLIAGIAVYFILRHRRNSVKKSRFLSSSAYRPSPSNPSAFVDEYQSPTLSYHKQFPVTSPTPSTLANSNVHARFNAVAPFQDLEPEPERPDGLAAGSPVEQGSPGRTHPWSPIKALFGGVKDGADSMKSTFLKV